MCAYSQNVVMCVKVKDHRGLRTTEGYGPQRVMDHRGLRTTEG